MCDCAEKTLKIFKEQLDGKSAEFKSSVFTGGGGSRFWIPVVVNHKKGGKTEASLLPTFCPICGKRYSEKS